MTEVETFSKIVKFKDVNGRSQSMFATYVRKAGESEYTLIPEHKKLYEELLGGKQ